MLVTIKALSSTGYNRIFQLLRAEHHANPLNNALHSGTTSRRLSGNTGSYDYRKVYDIRMTREVAEQLLEAAQNARQTAYGSWTGTYNQIVIKTEKALS